MGFKTQLDIGCFSWDRGAGAFLSRPLTPAEVDAAIVRCGGRLLTEGHPSEPQLSAIAGLMVRHGGQDVRGFLGREPVVLHPLGYARLALDDRSAGPVAAFLRLLSGEFGCGVYRWDDTEQDTGRVIAWLEQLAEHKHAEPLSWPTDLNKKENP
jgi:hypothetical protein